MKLTNIILFLLLSFFAFTAQAKNGIYMILESGYANQPGLPSAGQAGASSRSTAFLPSAIRAGIGYNHDLWECFGIGLDLGIGQYGKVTYDYTSGDGDVSSRTLEFLALAQFHLQQWDIIGKIGGVRQTVVMTGTNSQSNQPQVRPEVSIGTAYNFNSNWAMTGTYAHVFGKNINSFDTDDLQGKTPSLNEFLLGVRYSFN